MRLQNLIEELERQEPLKWDQKIDSSQLGMVLDESPKFQLNGKENLFTITRPCHNQIAERLEIPVKYYAKMENESPELLAENVNTWLKEKPKEVFIRGLGDSVRAFLSNRYRVIDHLDAGKRERGDVHKFINSSFSKLHSLFFGYSPYHSPN
jgi:hypothetical protein